MCISALDRVARDGVASVDAVGVKIYDGAKRISILLRRPNYINKTQNSIWV